MNTDMNDEPKRTAGRCAMRVQGSLFGAVSLIREWGRIGSPGRVREDARATIGDLVAAAERIGAAKQRKGYR
jgi:predicted DNA-binding WGR domain protein